MKKKSKKINNDEIRRLLELIENEDEEAEKLTRKLLLNYNMMKIAYGETRVNERRLEIYEVDYHKQKEEIEKLKKRIEKKETHIRELIVENVKLSKKILENKIK